MRALLLAVLVFVRVAHADADLQRAFVDGMEAQRAGELARAEAIFRQMLESTDSPRVKLELARVLFQQARYAEAKTLFKEVALQSDTPWRVRDNVSVFVREIEERTGYWKLGATIVSDSNPRNLTAQREFTIAGIQVTPTQAPKRVTGLRYAGQGWLPIERIDGGAYASASYIDYPAQDLDRLTLDAGLTRNLVASGRVRGKAGLEFGTFGGQSLYRFPYVGLDAVLRESQSQRLVAELKAGRVLFPDFDYLEATYRSAALSLRQALGRTVSGTLRASLEGSSAAERPYSYYGWDVGPGLSTFWPAYTLVVGAHMSYGVRKYAEADPLFGERRADERTRAEVTVGNKRWRWRDSTIALAASIEEGRSNIAFYSYRKTNISVVVE